MFYPIADLSGWFRATAHLNPMTWQVDLLRFSLLDIGDPVVIALEAVAFGVFTVICLAAAMRAPDAVT